MFIRITPFFCQILERGDYTLYFGFATRVKNTSFATEGVLKKEKNQFSWQVLLLTGQN